MREKSKVQVQIQTQAQVQVQVHHTTNFFIVASFTCASLQAEGLFFHLYVPVDAKLNDICFVLVPNDLFQFFPICFVPADAKLNGICFVLVLKQIKTNKNKRHLVLFGTKATLTDRPNKLQYPIHEYIDSIGMY